jgi:hypothetical protein
MDHLYNIKRSTVVYNELLDEGINAIPDVSWFNRNDIDRWCDEINKKAIKNISFSFQVVDVQLKASNLWKTYLLGFRYLCENINPEVNIIVAGVTSHRRLIDIFAAAPGRRISILNQSAYVQSMRGMLSENRQSELRLPRNVVFERNLAYFNKIYAEMNSDRNGGV